MKAEVRAVDAVVNVNQLVPSPIYGAEEHQIHSSNFRERGFVAICKSFLHELAWHF